MSDWVIPKVENKPLLDDGRDICPSVIGVPVVVPPLYLLNPHYGAGHFKADQAPKPYHRVVEEVRSRDQLYPHDSLGFGGFPGINFLQRNTKQE